MTRFVDGPAVEVEVDIDAGVDVVWELVSDVDLPGRFSDEFEAATWLDGATRPAVGARFRGKNRHPAIGSWETVSTITACEEGRLLAWAVDDPTNPASTWRFELEPIGGRTILRQSAQIGPGPSGLTFEIDAAPEREEEIVRRRLDTHRRNMQRTVDGVKALAETA